MANKFVTLETAELLRIGNLSEERLLIAISLPPEDCGFKSWLSSHPETGFFIQPQNAIRGLFSTEHVEFGKWNFADTSPDSLPWSLSFPGGCCPGLFYPG